MDLMDLMDPMDFLHQQKNKIVHLVYPVHPVCRSSKKYSRRSSAFFLVKKSFSSSPRLPSALIVKKRVLLEQGL